MTTHWNGLLHLVQALAAVLETLLGAGVTQLAGLAFTLFATPVKRQMSREVKPTRVPLAANPEPLKVLFLRLD